jgi:hypothetical protein
MALYPPAISNIERQYAEEWALFAGRSFSICEAAYEYSACHPEEGVLYHLAAVQETRSLSTYCGRFPITRAIQNAEKNFKCKLKRACA